MIARILAIGTATPKGRLSQARAIDLARTLSPPDVPEGVIENLHARTSIKQRGSVLVNPLDGSQTTYHADPRGRGPSTAARLANYTRDAAALAIQASADALSQSATPPHSITHLITVSCTGFESPGVDQKLVWALGLSPSIPRTHIGFMGCHAAMNALAVARAIAESDPAAVVLVSCVELCTLHMHYSSRMDQLVSNALFADGAASVVVSQRGSPECPRILACASRLFPDSEASMAWSIGDHGFEMTLAPDVPQRLTDAIPPWIDSILRAASLDRSSIGGWAIHPGGPKIVEVIAGALSLERSATAHSLAILHEHGNMSSATVLFILRRMMESLHPRPWMAMAFGPGLAAEAIVLG